MRPVVGRIERTHEGHAGRTEDQGRHHKKAINPGTDKIGKRKQQIHVHVHVQLNIFLILTSMFLKTVLLYKAMYNKKKSLNITGRCILKGGRITPPQKKKPHKVLSINMVYFYLTNLY